MQKTTVFKKIQHKLKYIIKHIPVVIYGEVSRLKLVNNQGRDLAQPGSDHVA